MGIKIMLILLYCVTYSVSQVPEKIIRYRLDAKGEFQYRLQGIFDGNRVRTLYKNNGEVGQWPYIPSLEWPKGSHHQNLDGYTFMVAAAVKAPGNSQVIHPLETSYREEMPQDPVTGLIWGFEPLPGYANINNPSKTPALSNSIESYPSSWPAALGLSSIYNGHWYGYYGNLASDDVLETFYVMDDSKDGKYKRPPYNYYPVISDSNRGGLGLRVEVRGMQFKHAKLQDIVFFNYNTTNISDFDYDTTVFGMFLDPGVGGFGSGLDDACYNLSNDFCYSWDHEGIGDPQYGDWNTGYVGFSVLFSPNNINNRNISSVSVTPLADKGPNGVWPKNNETVWRKMTGGLVDTSITNSNITIVLASNSFKLSKWTSQQFDVAMILGDNLTDIISKNYIAHLVHDNKFIISDSLLNYVQHDIYYPLEYLLAQNYPNPFNPSTTIRYALPSSAHVRLTIHDILGREIATLVNEEQSPGWKEVQWNARHASTGSAEGGQGYASGVYFYKIEAGSFVDVKKMLIVK